MNSISFDVVKSMIHQKKYDAITEFAHVEFPDKGELVVTEYAGTGVRVYKDSEDRTRILCPKEMDVIQEGTVANEIANGTIFDDADEVDNNAEMIEKTSIPYSAMINSGKDVPKKLKPMIAIVIGRIDDGEEFSVSDNDRITGNNFVRDLVCCKDKGTTVPAVVDDYLGKDKDAFHTPEMGRDVADLDKEVSDIQDTKTEDVITDDDTVEDYGGKIPQSGDFDDYADGVNLDDHDKDPKDDEDKSDDDTDDSNEKEEEDEDTEEDSDDDDSEKDDDEDQDDKLSPEEVDEFYSALKTELNDESYQEGFLSKKPKKLKPIPRDVVAYITVEMNAIRSSNDQAMLSGYTCSKIELVDFYLTVLDTQDPRYIVPHTKQYLETMKRDLENLLTQILRIRPINRGDKIWRVNVNYPEGRM